ncbi:TetR/AcrR family transcriptional regulator [Tuwongella immobilis]|uniref:HTH tetR-type domain-containing protein n=1 Tax=Tuwongella immobilis TaxID=692036 RepID=A0A6C2YSL5_9BACT|nr:TetR/AcrR family transcriptional regulator [Tuwongella immobilis]VIP04690.1 transcriptional regulator : Transcriptional regulator, TetR family OS=Methylobacterium nodulans (strain ORS2060 / LMG 21967) GN=Mnod_8100 PE=4 SV=1: TetR_N [Tuwongella immobilis]VTS06739.1 transcriptional regulator : Transcriptional regulator, TetR family OS=Methylobacterium nodulans (strain ORS2060 / LMG 21967) GN=Mnod_8100 PE=4 SV=1: TetR_N [Tuwongella immobilis]
MVPTNPTPLRPDSPLPETTAPDTPRPETTAQPDTSTGAKRRQRRKEDRPQEILQAALIEFTEQGFADTKVESIAARAGIAKGTVYRYFPTKEAIFEGLVTSTIAPVFALPPEFADAQQSAGERLCKLIRRLYALMIETPDRQLILRILLSEGHKFPQLLEFYHRVIFTKARAIIQQLVDEGIRSGEFRAEHIAKVPQVLIGPALMAVVWSFTFDTIDPLPRDEFLQAHLELVLHGLRGSAPREIAPGLAASAEL